MKDHRVAGDGGGADLARHDLRARGHDQAHPVLERLAGKGDEDVGGPQPYIEREDPRAVTRSQRRGAAGAAAVRNARGRRVPHAGPPARARAGGLKRSFQTFFIASTTMSLVIFDSPTLRSTKTMGSSTTRKPSWWTR